MQRLLRMGSKWYAIELKGEDALENDLENIQSFLDESTTVILGSDLEDMANDIGIELNDIEVVDPDNAQDD